LCVIFAISPPLSIQGSLLHPILLAAWHLCRTLPLDPGNYLPFAFYDESVHSANTKRCTG
jgi:hypothetical protein